MIKHAKMFFLLTFAVFSVAQADNLFQRATHTFTKANKTSTEYFLEKVFEGNKNLVRQMNLACVHNHQPDTDFYSKTEVRGREDLVSPYYISTRTYNGSAPGPWVTLGTRSDGEFGTQTTPYVGYMVVRHLEIAGKDYLITWAFSAETETYCWSEQF